MDDAPVGELEAAIADLGTLLVGLQKYRRGAGPEGAALVRAATTLGDAARRLHRHERLDAAAAGRLLDEARNVQGDLRALLAAIRASAEYRAAVAAHAAGDRATLSATLPALFAALEAVPLPPALYQAVPWRRRGRIRPAADMAGELARLRDDGLVAEGDDLSAGADAELPAIALQDVPPVDEPLAVRIATVTLDTPVHRLVDTGDYLIHAPRLRVAFAVRIATELPEDETESASVDYPQYRHELAAALARAGIAVDP